jgi:hypothetical protein
LRHVHVALLLASCAFAQRSASSAAIFKVHEIRAKINLQNWDDGGELSRWVYLHSTEVFPSAIVRRSGPVRELPLHLRPASEVVSGNQRLLAQLHRRKLA